MGYYATMPYVFNHANNTPGAPCNQVRNQSFNDVLENELSLT